MLREEVGCDDPHIRLLDARYAAARALLLEVLGNCGPARDPQGPWAELRSEGALVGLLVRCHGWSHIGPGQLRRGWRAN